MSLPTEITDFLGILDESPVGVSVSRRRDGKVVFANRRFCEITGMAREQCIGHPARRLFADDAQRHEVVRQLKEAGEIVDADVKFFRVDGSSFWSVLTIRPATLNGEAVNLAWIYDVSKRKLAEQAILDGRALIRAMLDSSTDGIVLLNAQGTILALNAAAAAIFEKSGEDLPGQPAWDHLPDSVATPIRRGIEGVLARGDSVESHHAIGARLFDIHMHPVANAAGHHDRVAMFSRDVTQIHQRRLQLRKLETALEQAPVSVMITDSHGAIEYVNRAFVLVSGYSEDEVLGRNPRLLKSGETVASLYRDMWYCLSNGTTWQGELCNRAKDGSLFWEYATISPIRDDNGAVTHFMAVKENITQRKQAEQLLVHQATHDTLTGLPNRLLLEDRVHHAIEVAKREGRRIGLMFLDLDRFKIVNDSLGHVAGDQLLKVVADRLRHTLRRSDTVARLGGDEFVVVLTHFQSSSELAEVAEKISAALDEPVELAGHKVHVGASIGIALYPEDGDNFNALMKDADTAMYRAKQKGRNTFCFYDSNMNDEALDRLKLEEALRRALVRGEFQLFYQPQVDLQTGQTSGVEALIRWNSPDRGQVSPALFIPVAEESNLISMIGWWVLEESCRQIAAWREEGLSGIKVAVNVSGRQFLNHALVECISDLMAQYGVQPAQLEIELTESTVMAEPERAIEQLNRLREIGIQVSVDDFGTGYSSLSYLKRLPLSTIKVDRSFVRDVNNQSENAAIVSAILGLADALDMSIVAEGVETEGEERHLRDAGCIKVQGFRYAKPMPANQLAGWLQQFQG
ncbi:Putative Adenylyl cyclase class-3/4/guanylyl cyclase,378-537 and Diguanylate phosphodiesterase, EAL domain,544-790 [Magnetospirillum sp. XM-1]|uniref:sensor domain-containing protein n=1 Tax=Magnetospirillum sp. XM-1 TaxID=1663591 RepID=UPI00073DF2B3|nr:EAL domain-containing protein [Magnetospirillum sp. XM-1]CUW38916.1 Putative Adenylyl cyclase class-3/4/guanylyl cyclase,378-537 and Diguanylate phosphodiesterase, EAL domain,544-790 [Magnetospirillum sp. XM-1]